MTRRAQVADLATAITMLDSEEHRYVERYTACPHGCVFDYDPRSSHAPDPRLVRVAGPTDCDLCDAGTIEDEDAHHLDGFIASLRALHAALVGPQP